MAITMDLWISPNGYQLNAINRWRFQSHKGWEGQAGANVLTEDRQGGQLSSETARAKVSIGLEHKPRGIMG